MPTYYHLWSKFSRINYLITAVMLLSLQLNFTATVLATTTVSGEDYTLQEDDYTGIQIEGNSQIIDIKDNVTLTNTVDGGGDVVTCGTMITGDPGIIDKAATINIGVNSNIIAADNHNAINMVTSLQAGRIIINNRGNIVAEPNPNPIDINTINDEDFIDEHQAINFFRSTPSLELNNYGDVIGDIAGSKYNDVIFNYGNIKGNIYGSQGNDVIKFMGGKIEGDINGGSGDNQLYINYDFDTYGTIFSFGSIQVNAGNLNIRHPITEVNTGFTNRSNVNLEPPGSLIGVGDIYNDGNMQANINLQNSLVMQDVYNTGNLFIDNTADSGVELGRFINDSGATAIFQNTGLNGVKIAELCNCPNASLGIINQTHEYSDVVIDFFNANSGVLNLSGGIQITSSQLINDPDAKINFQHPGAEIFGVGEIINNGVVEVQATTTLEGGYTVGDGGIHIIHIKDSVPATLAVQGSANFYEGAALQVINDTASILSDGQIIPVVTGTETATMFASNNVNFNNVKPSVVLQYRAYNQDNDIVIKVNKKSYTSVLSNPTPNIVTMANVFKGINFSDNVRLELKGYIAKLDQATSGEKITYEIDQFIPDVSVVHSGNSGIQSTSIVFNQINDRILNIAKLDPDHYSQQLARGYNAGDSVINRHIWLKPFGAYSRQRALTESNGYQAKLLGLSIGADYNIYNDVLIGTSLSYARTSGSSKDLLPDQTNINALQFTIYSNYLNNKYYVNSYLATSFNSYRTARLDPGNPGVTFNGKFNGIQPAVKIDFGIPKHLYWARITPNVSLQYLYLHQKKYNETGIGVNFIDVSSKDTHLLRGGIGVRTELLQSGKWKNFMPELRIMGWYDVINTRPQLQTKFQGGGEYFMFTGDRLARFTLNAGLGLNYVNSNGIGLALNYDVFSKKKFISHYGSMLIKYTI